MVIKKLIAIVYLCNIFVCVIDYLHALIGLVAMAVFAAFSAFSCNEKRKKSGEFFMSNILQYEQLNELINIKTSKTSNS